MEVLWFLVENKGWGEWLLRMLGIWGPGHEGKYLLIYENFSNYTNLSSQVGSRGRGGLTCQSPRSAWSPFLERVERGSACLGTFLVLCTPMTARRGKKWEASPCCITILVPARTQSWVLWSHIFPSIISWVSHPVECNCHFYWIKPIRLFSKDEENATSPTKQFLLCLKGLSFSLLWGREKERVRECVCSALYLDFYLNLGMPDLLFPSFSCNSSLIFFKSNKPPSQTLTKESQPWRSPGLGIEANLILVAGNSL